MASIGNIEIRDTMEYGQGDNLMKFGNLCICNVLLNENQAECENIEIGTFQISKSKPTVLQVKKEYSKNKLLDVMKSQLKIAGFPISNDIAGSFIDALNILNEIEDEYTQVKSGKADDPLFGVILGNKNREHYIYTVSGNLSIGTYLEDLKQRYRENEKYFGTEASLMVFTNLNDFDIGEKIVPELLKNAD